MKYIIVFVQVLMLVWLVALAFPQNGQSNRERTNCPTCVTTAEYNPVCGTDNVTYLNMGRFNCAKQCNPDP